MRASPQHPQRDDIRRLRRAGAVAGLFVLVLWWIKLTELALGYDLSGLGVYPRTQSGAIGILTAPLVHGDWQHLFANTLPLLVLGIAAVYGYPRSWPLAVTLIWLGSGVGVWLFARASYHIGASGLTHGLMFFAFVAGILRRDSRSVALAMLVFFLYGGMVWSVFPQKPGVSFESHFFGAAMGVLCAVLFRRWDPAPPRKVYSWELEPEDAEDPIIGDAWKQDPESSPEHER